MPSTPETLQTAAQSLVRVMVAHGITTVFGTVGHGNLSLIDAIAGEKRLNFVSAFHEQVAIHAADAYFRVSGRVAAVVTTVGPGATNLTTGLGDALLDSSAVIVITGGVPSEYVRKDPLQSLSVAADNSQSEIFRPLTKRVFEVGSSADLVPTFSRAFSEAINGRPGPVLMHVPLDFFAGPVPATNAESVAPARFVPFPDPAQIALAAKAIGLAERPVLYCGGGAQAEGAPEAITELAREFGIPVATTMSGQGVIDEDDPLAMGTTGVVGTRPGNTVVREADLVIAVGTRFPEMDTSSWRSDFFSGFPPAKLIHIDIDPLVLNRVFPSDVAINADAAAAVRALRAELRSVSPEWSDWSERAATLREDWSRELEEVRSTPSMPFEPAFVLTRLREQLPAAAVLVSGVGVRHAVAQHYPVRSPRTLVVASGFGTMGQETAAPLGAVEALPGTPVVAVVGDGAVLACLAALPTAAAAGENVTWVVLDNGGYASIAIYQAKHFGRLLGTDFVDAAGAPYTVDFVQLAQSFGISADRVVSESELDEKLAAAIAHGGPSLVVVPITRTPRIQGTGHWDVNDIFAAGATYSRAGEGGDV
ncbi:thiamine pyrophosphate-binding protein [Cryobacterium tagatosivorans]|nr:thiamine pyrophosphate-binding protein [Cryobacterium tagatosivorans]